MPNPDHPFYVLRDTCQRYQATLVVVSKTRTIEAVDELYQMGQRIFAENKTKGLLEKAQLMAGDIEWHLIGHLQTNKVKSILPYVTCIQSLDSVKLWTKIQEEAATLNKTVTCLLQIKIAQEETKFGWSIEELNQLLLSGVHLSYPNVIIGGVMGMASLTDDRSQIRLEMILLKSYFVKLKLHHFASNPNFKTISMGMSGDYQIALEEGSNMIRVGSLLFD